MILPKPCSSQKTLSKTYLFIFASTQAKRKRRVKKPKSLSLIIYINSWNSLLRIWMSTSKRSPVEKELTLESKKHWCSPLELWRMKSVVRKTWKAIWKICLCIMFITSWKVHLHSWGRELAKLMECMEIWSSKMTNI